jgi:SAM-dependent methyltransferase
MISKIKKLLISNSIVKSLLLAYTQRERQIFKHNKTLFIEKNGVEIGGPSRVFASNHAFPVYGILKKLDNINYSDTTFWSSIGHGESYVFEEGKQPGIQIIADGIDLSVIKDESYDFMLSSHVIEHIANPIKALYEWKRVIKRGGYLVIIAPNMNRTYDRKRPLTQLSHIIADYEKKTPETDDTHFQEVIDLHDLTNDGTVASYEEHVARTLDNKRTRIVHHHTFDLELLASLVKYCNFEIIDQESFYPYHLMVIARRID